MKLGRKFNLIWLNFLIQNNNSNNRKKQKFKNRMMSQQMFPTSISFLKMLQKTQFYCNHQLRGLIVNRILNNFLLEIWGGADTMPKMLEKSRIIEDYQFLQIISHMPSIFRIANWILPYSSWKHGSSLFTLLRQSENYSPVVLLVKDLDDYIFGAYLSEGLKMTSGHFYGSGETFLFSFFDSKKCILFKWTQINNFFVLSDQDGIAVGCGDKYGLFLNSELSGGYSTTCETFANDQLSKNHEFIIDQVEVWAIDL